MLPTTPSYERLALNSATFGARTVDEAYAQQIGWDAWVNEQLSAPPGDDPEVAGLIANATLKIAYSAKTNEFGGWSAVNEERPLTALAASPLALWDIYKQRDKTLPNKEIYRTAEEVVAATWMRSTHSAYQVRELMVDFWHNHFNVSINQTPTVATGTAAYDRDVIRPHVFGNFRDMLEANATSVSMLFYLDNAISQPEIPNENYARELLELHTLGENAYLGQTDPDSVTKYASGIAIGFTDEDIVQASRALSGWTVGSGNRLGKQGALPSTGDFHYEPLLHNTEAGTFMGQDLTSLSDDMAQGQAILDIAAYHDETAIFLCNKICRRIFGDSPPSNVVTAAATTWLANQTQPDQLRRVMEAILLSSEIGQPASKLRLPVEKTVAFMRAVGATAVPHRSMFNLLKNTSDQIFTWPGPNGHPDVDGYWLSTTALMTEWNAVLDVLNKGMTDISVTNESILTDSVTELVEDWVERIIGFEPSGTKMNQLIDFAMGLNGVLTYLGQGSSSATTVESHLRKLVGMIATIDEFAYR
ncbi:MAG: DUF1800 domain-containing protein [Rhodospirillaceae bacterium]|nr:DUF1800 domain-containing protein [Rhodospirillaceae bacterium]